MPVFGAGARNVVCGFRARLGHRREFTLGGHGALSFQAEGYPAINRMFDAIANQDRHVVLLKPVPAPAATEAPAPK